MNSLPRKRSYKKLRNRLSNCGLTLLDLGEATGLSESAVVSRMMGRQSWSIDQAYAILSFLDLPEEYLSEYFPADIFEEVPA